MAAEASVTVTFDGKCWACRRRTIREAERVLLLAPISLTAERHYVHDPEDVEDEAEYGANFAECTPKARLRHCPVCEATTSATIERRWQIKHICWAMWCLVDSAAEALSIAQDDADGCGCDLDYTVEPTWMVKAEVPLLGEWEA